MSKSEVLRRATRSAAASVEPGNAAALDALDRLQASVRDSGVDVDFVKMHSTVYTIGHSNHSLQDFMALLEKYGISAVADVRSAPYSRFVKHFNREPLAASLGVRGIDYVHLGRELGGRSDDPTCYERGRIRYDRVAATDSFREAIRRVILGSSRYRITLMCAEKEPLDCHRTLLLAPALEEKGVEVVHILADGTVEKNHTTMERLMHDCGLVQGDLFGEQKSRTERIREAIAVQAGRVGYVNVKLVETRRKN